MLRIFSNSYKKIFREKNLFEEQAHVRLGNKGKIIEISGSPENEYIAERIVHAIELGFPVNIALLLTEEDYMLETLNIKSYARGQNLQRVKSRIIGMHGKTLKTLSDVSECFIKLKNNTIALIGTVENVEVAYQAIQSLIKGSEQANVYRYLEKHRPKEIVDYGLKKREK
jgi:KH domain-containing protein